MQLQASLNTSPLCPFSCTRLPFCSLSLSSLITAALRVFPSLKGKMGRKPKSVELSEKSQKHESANRSVEDVQVELESKNPCATSVDEMEPQEANFSKMSSQKKVKETPAKVRRSQHLQSSVMTTEDQYIERIIDEITVSESEKEDEPADEELPEPTMNGKNTLEKVDSLKEKVDYLVQLVEAQQQTIDELKSRVMGKTFFNNRCGIGDITYKSLYFDSQKKVEALMKVNNQLNKDLEFARGKMEVYEKVTRAMEAMMVNASSRALNTWQLCGTRYSQNC